MRKQALTVVSIILTNLLGAAECLVIDNVSEYCVPDEKSVAEVSNSLVGHFRGWIAHSLLMPKRPKGKKLKLADEMSGRTYEMPLERGASIKLPEGTYRVRCDGYGLTIEEFLSECNRKLSMKGSVRIPNTYGRSNQSVHIKCFLYPIGSLVEIRGKVANTEGKGIPNVTLKGCPMIIDETDAKWHEAKTVQTDADGAFAFRGLAPASLDLAVRYFLFGDVMKASFDSEKIFSFSFYVDEFPLGYSKPSKSPVSVPLISERNAVELRTLANRIRSLGIPKDGGEFSFVDEDVALKKLPASTNNVIFAETIVLPSASPMKPAQNSK